MTVLVYRPVAGDCVENGLTLGSEVTGHQIPRGATGEARPEDRRSDAATPPPASLPRLATGLAQSVPDQAAPRRTPRAAEPQDAGRDTRDRDAHDRDGLTPPRPPFISTTDDQAGEDTILP
ncbi:hypothetical protein AB0F16_24240, partial [Streptomyces tanashiensis]|uniref:hypothetical protein n=1 Tax=Streptomyces tanashiensis TaxID=67367 RepID=UPI0033D7A83F